MSTCTAPARRDAVSPLHRWIAIAVLAVATFTIVVTEFAPIGLLSSIAADLHERPATVGLIVSAYAWIGAGSALLSAVLPNHFPRKPLLIGLMLLLAASSGVSAVAPAFPALMLARIAGALAHGVFWAMVAALATQIAPRDRLGLATAVVFGGISIASVLGVPIVNVIGQHWDWRVAFGALSGLSLLTALLMAAALPTIRAEGSVGGAALAGVLRNRALWMAYAVAIFTIAAHFGAFTFIEPYLRQMPGVAPAAVALLLFAFGAAGLLGNVLTGLAIDRHFKTVIVAALAFMCAALIGLGWLVPRAGTAAAVACLLAWGAAISALFVGIQTWVLRAGGAAAIPASALYTTVFNGASGIGAMLGASILARSGLSAVMLAAGGGVACAACLVVAARPDGKA
ncbi:MFS transporter [Burkholderia ubonensis]|uniref:MFS transporter n=1 Tax=Burkholderia ubonensis TaxID=101571 RepID=A0A107EME6_9BURK|nr:MFS transporter [Burkholderia ubonensis]KWD77517.1 MFS transporter [Burkholderia ubonensis]KWD82383.1 MFS transporter [Burkholderia ubonensis]KWD95424.1 MFS transporter [Burkholderia ubonensis]KWD95810.1 MFS transporter [Burkholderia ubonensis]